VEYFPPPISLLNMLMEIMTNESVVGGRRRRKAFMRKHSLKTDMTPMVDLGFLLIAFFIMTTELNKPVVTKLNVPHDGPATLLGMSNAMTVIMGKNNTVYYYHGEWQDALNNNQIIQTTFAVKDGFGKAIREKQQALDALKSGKPGAEGRDGLMLLIKATPEASYSNMIDVLDEVAINRVKKYALVKPTADEIRYVR
jgi:biopolymer transport protein ExbD